MLVPAGIACLLAGGEPSPARDPGQEPPPLELRVNRAIARGVQHLFETQLADGRWLSDENRYPGGLTAFVAYTLVKSGVRRNDADLGEALQALAEIEPKSTYGTSARLLLYETLGSREQWLPSAERCLDLLVEFQREGLWAYPDGGIDMSNVQFALLGLYAARNLGLDVPERTLVACAKAIWRFHDESGGFRYRADILPTGGITAATLGGVAILERFGEDVPAVRAELKKHRKDVVAAHEWLADSWDPERNAWGAHSWTPAWKFPYLWAVERYCEMSGLPLLDLHDWYAEGAEHLVAIQEENGGWGKTEDTCFALLFLRRTTFSGGSELAEIYSRIDATAAAAKPPVPKLNADAPFLADWLLAGPFAGEPGESGLHDPPFDPTRLRIKERSKVGGQKWERVELRPGWTNLEELTGRGGDFSVWALATVLRYPAGGIPKGVELEPLEAMLWFAFEDGWRVFVDGEEVSTGIRVQAPIRDDVRVPVTLTPGEHAVVVVLEDALGAAAFNARLSDPNGQPLLARIGWGFGERKNR